MELQSLKDIYLKKGMGYIKKLLDGHVTITEKLNAVRFSFTYDGTKLVFENKNGNISVIERTLSKLYEDPINHFEKNFKKFESSLQPGFRYGFRYFNSTKPISIQYDKLPLNNLVLTDIRTNKGKYISDPNMLNPIAENLQVQKSPIIFYGELNEEQKIHLSNFIRTPLHNLLEKFKTTSFTRYMISIINPDLKNLALSESLDAPIDSIIFTFKTEDQTVNAKELDPCIYEINLTIDKREPIDLYGIILSDILEFTNIHGIFKYDLSETNVDERCLELICKLYNDYIIENSYKFEGVELDNLSFTNVEYFDINSMFIKNPMTVEYINESDINKNIFRIMLNGLTKIKKRPTGTLTEDIIKESKKISDRIKDKINDDLIDKTNTIPSFEDFYKNKR